MVTVVMERICKMLCSTVIVCMRKKKNKPLAFGMKKYFLWNFVGRYHFWQKAILIEHTTKKGIDMDGSSYKYTNPYTRTAIYWIRHLLVTLLAPGQIFESGLKSSQLCPLPNIWPDD